MTLSRDANVSGNRVATENYLQHAEHYLRIVAAGHAHHEEQAAARAAQHSAANGGNQPEVRNGDGRDGDAGSARPPRKGKYDEPVGAANQDEPAAAALGGEETANDVAPVKAVSGAGDVVKDAKRSDDNQETVTVGDGQDA